MARVILKRLFFPNFCFSNQNKATVLLSNNNFSMRYDTFGLIIETPNMELLKSG